VYIILVTFLLQHVNLHPALFGAGHIASLRDSHAILCSMVERISSLFQSILAIASLNTFLYMVYTAYYWVLGVYDLDPRYSQQRVIVALGSSGWLAFTISNYFLFVRSCELAVSEVCIFVVNILNHRISIFYSLLQLTDTKRILLFTQDKLKSAACKEEVIYFGRMEICIQFYCSNEYFCEVNILYAIGSHMLINLFVSSERWTIKY
jgi:hypothetical protein